MEEAQTQIYESFTIRHADVSISISSRPDGILENKSDDEILKYCADVLLGLTDDESLEAKIEIPLAIQETLEKDFGWDRNKTFEFIRRLKKRLYMMNIGESDSKEERSEMVRQQKEERAKEKFKESTGIDVEVGGPIPEVSVESNVVTVLPSKQNFSKEDTDAPVAFSMSGDDASATMPRRKVPEVEENSSKTKPNQTKREK